MAHGAVERGDNRIAWTPLKWIDGVGDVNGSLSLDASPSGA